MARSNGAGDSGGVKGRPLLAYHGTGDAFSEFDARHAGKASGATDALGVFWFAANPQRANAAARDAAIVKNDRNDMEYEEGANVMPVYLHLQRLKRYLGWVPGTDKSAQQIVAARAKGFDGVVWELGERMGASGLPSGPVYAVFDAAQITSAVVGDRLQRADRARSGAPDRLREVVEAGLHVGVITEVRGDHLVQHVGRGVHREHALERLDRVPTVGVVATIRYEGGRGMVAVASEVERGR